MGDTGLTGRKIIVDTYGGAARHGGGAFSGKDPTKVDRSAAYAARYVAKNVVAAGLADRCELQVAYAIGVAHPVSMEIDCFGTEKLPISRIEELVREDFDLRPAAIQRDLDLRRPIYAKTAAYGHFGRADHDFTWERTDKADALRARSGHRRPGHGRRRAVGRAPLQNGATLAREWGVISRLRPQALPLSPAPAPVVVARTVALPVGRDRPARRRAVPDRRTRLAAQSLFPAAEPVRHEDGRPDRAGRAEGDRGPRASTAPASGHFETIVDVEKDTRLPASSSVSGRLFLAVGDVDALVDFHGLDAHAVDVSSDRRSATITLPPPRFTDARLDVDRSRVVDHVGGPQRHRLGLRGQRKRPGALVLAERKLEAAARSGSGCSPVLEANTTRLLEGLLRSLGLRHVTVRFESAPAL